MSDLRRLSASARTLVLLAAFGAALAGLAGLAGAAVAPAAPASSPPPPPPPVARQEIAKPLPPPRLRTAPVVTPPGAAPGESAAVRLMVFSLQRQRVFDALTVVRPLLSVQGSVELDPTHNTISVRDNLAALSRVATAIRAFDRENQPVRIDVQLILAETAKISPVPSDAGISRELLDRLRQLLNFKHFSLLAQSQITSREGEAVVYEMARGYRLSFEVGSIAEGKRIRLAGFRMVRDLPGQTEHELVRTVVHLGLDQPLILGLTRDEAADRALMLVLRYQSASTPTVAAAGR